ncbi:MAG TPA: hypothetical protein VKY92_25680 [Verrucomicrobiae bacterium]|nr:hypothetical protein [Verrucomicrobiae bacterium]
MALALPPLVLLGFLVIEHLRGHIALAHYVHTLRAQGEKMNAREFLLPIPAGENGAPEILVAAKELKPGQILPKTFPPRMRLTPLGHAIVGFREDQWVEDKVTNHWDSLAADLATNAATLNRIEAAMTKPVLNCEFDPTLGPLARFPHLPVPKTLTQWFGPRIALGLHEGRTRETLRDLVTEIELPRLLAPDGIVISELVREAIAAVAFRDVWEALQADGWTDDDLAQLQRAWEAQHFAEPMVRALEGERVFAQSSYDLMRHSNQQTASLLFWTSENLPDEEKASWERVVRELPGGNAMVDFFKKELFCRVWRFAWLDQDQLHYLHYLEGLIALGRDASRQKSFQKLQPLEDRLVVRFQNHGVYDRLRYFSEMSVGSLSRALNRAMRAETERSMVLAAIAIKRYAGRHGSVPESLDALVPEWLASVPVDYMNGEALRFRRQQDGGFALYSVGEDGTDDGGNATLSSDKTISRVIWNRKDAVWPAPANAAEVEVFRRESAKE